MHSARALLVSFTEATGRRIGAVVVYKFLFAEVAEGAKALMVNALRAAFPDRLIPSLRLCPFQNKGENLSWISPCFLRP